MGYVDAMSRLEDNNVVATIETEDIEFKLCAAQARDKIICDLNLKLEEKPVDGYEMENGLIYRKLKDGLRFYVP